MRGSCRGRPRPVSAKIARGITGSQRQSVYQVDSASRGVFEPRYGSEGHACIHYRVGVSRAGTARGVSVPRLVIATGEGALDDPELEEVARCSSCLPHLVMRVPVVTVTSALNAFLRQLGLRRLLGRHAAPHDRRRSGRSLRHAVTQTGETRTAGHSRSTRCETCPQCVK